MACELIRSGYFCSYFCRRDN